MEEKLPRGCFKKEYLGKIWTFDFGMNGWRRAEATTGMKMNSIIKNIDGNALVLCQLIQGTLQRFHPDVSLDEAGDIVTEGGDDLIMEAIEALKREEKSHPTVNLQAVS